MGEMVALGLPGAAGEPQGMAEDAALQGPFCAPAVSGRSQVHATAA
jgi:hypothetical protein